MGYLRLTLALFFVSFTSLCLAGCGGDGSAATSNAGIQSEAPQILSSPVVSATSGTAYVYAAQINGSLPITPHFSGLPSWLNANGTTISGTPGSGDVGLSSDITLTLTNSAGTTSQTFQILVSDVSGQDALEGSIYQINDPRSFSFELTGPGDELGFPSVNVSATVELISGAALFSLDDRNNPVTIQYADFVSELGAGEYSSVRASGLFDSGSSLLLASSVEVEYRPQLDGGTGSAYSNVVNRPFSFDLTLTTGFLEGVAINRNVTVTVTLSPNPVLTQQSARGRPAALTAAELITGLNASTWTEIEAEGTYDARSNTLTAQYITAYN